jgi:outer membrane protein
MKKSKLLPCAALLLALHGDARAMDVAAAYRQAIANDPTALAADEALLAGRELAVQGDALLRPRVNLQASVNRIHDRMTGDLAPPVSQLLSSSGTGTAAQASLQLVQPLYDRAARANRDQLHEQTVLAQTRFDASRQDLALRVAQVYFGVLVAEETVRVVEAEMAAVRKQRDRAQARFEVGQGNITDVREAQARLDAVTTKQVSAQSMLALRREEFRETTGVAPAGLDPLANAFVPRLPEPAQLAAWQARGEAANPLVHTRRSELDIARAELGKHRLTSRPRLDLVASYGAKNQSGSLSPLVAPDGDRSGSIGVVLNVPLYAGGALDSRQREAAAHLGQAEQELAAARRDVRLKVQEGFLAVTTGVSRIASQEQALVSAKSALEATTQGRDVGTRTELDVLDAQQRLNAAELDLVQGRADYLLGRLRLAAAAGELGEGDLRALGAWLAH